MTRQDIIKLVQTRALARATALFGTTQEALAIYGDYEGCQNLVYDYERDGQPMILRVSFRPDRPPEQIQAEVHFVNYLANHGARVSRAVPSVSGNLVETLAIDGQTFVVVSFVKGKGMRVSDNGYRYREGVSISEYFQNWGRTLGQLHALSKCYAPLNLRVRRPEWLEWRTAQSIDACVPESLPIVREKFKGLLEQLQALPKSADGYGLIHNDFNDGNFTVNYDNGDITVFDFDDACYGWFVYELAVAWEGGVGRTMFEPGAQERRAFMEYYFDQVMLGYTRENTLASDWLERLPLFLKVVEMDSLLCRLEYRAANALPLVGDSEVNYLVYCVEQDIPHLGLFDPSFDPEHPFSLEQTI